VSRITSTIGLISSSPVRWLTMQARRHGTRSTVAGPGTLRPFGADQPRDRGMMGSRS